MLTLGNIVFSNCFPVHAGLLTGNVPFPFKLRDGIPTELNRLLSEGQVDVSPSSSIEYAMNPGCYRILPGFSITSRTRVMSITFESNLPISELDKKTVALTTASATSNVLLRILLELINRVHPDYLQYSQGSEDPYTQADAVLTIGDLAIKRMTAPRLPYVYDLGELWHQVTGLPFVFALWQVNFREDQLEDLSILHRLLVDSKAYGISHLEELAVAGQSKFGLPAGTLLDYWRLFSYDFNEMEQRGLLTYYGYAAELGVIAAVPELQFVTI